MRPVVKASDGPGRSKRSAPWFVLCLSSNYGIVADAFTRQVDNKFSLKVRLGVKDPTSWGDRVGAASAGKIGDVKVGGVAVESCGASRWQQSFNWTRLQENYLIDIFRASWPGVKKRTELTTVIGHALMQCLTSPSRLAPNKWIAVSFNLNQEAGFLILDLRFWSKYWIR